MSQPLAMLLSIGIEAPIAAALIRALGWGSAARAAAAAALGTLLTHWFAWNWSQPLMAAIGDTPGFLAVEAGVTVVEAVVYRFLVPVNVGRALALSLAANGGSAAIGIVSRRLQLACAALNPLRSSANTRIGISIQPCTKAASA